MWKEVTLSLKSLVTQDLFCLTFLVYLVRLLALTYPISLNLQYIFNLYTAAESRIFYFLGVLLTYLHVTAVCRTL